MSVFLCACVSMSRGESLYWLQSIMCSDYTHCGRETGGDVEWKGERRPADLEIILYNMTNIRHSSEL